MAADALYGISELARSSTIRRVGNSDLGAFIRTLLYHRFDRRARPNSARPCRLTALLVGEQVALSNTDGLPPRGIHEQHQQAVGFHPLVSKFPSKALQIALREGTSHRKD